MTQPRDLKHRVRNEPLTSDQAANYQLIREQVRQELQELLTRHDQRMAAVDQESKTTRIAKEPNS
jgi:hypothetical protein